MSERPRSAELHEQARQLMPGGVSSPVRAFGSVGGTPVTVVEGQGPRVTDADGKEYIDYICAWGPLILGHAHPAVIGAVKEAAAHGTAFGTPVKQEIELARLITDAMPSVEKVRFVCSGTEAAMTAARLARAATGRDLIVKFAGGYHGHADHFLAAAGSGVLTLGIASTPGVPEAMVQQTVV
ncbi:MAG: aminotransferase class III-fold pyridoxal phosphate-dependent enzyme, partial [Planctomycetota bacterium]